MSDPCDSASANRENWAGTIDLCISPSADLVQVTTYEELVTALEGALVPATGAPNGKKIRLVGSGHSWSPGIVPGPQAYPAPTQGDPVPVLTTQNAILIDITGMSPPNAPRYIWLNPYLPPRAPSGTYDPEQIGIDYPSAEQGTGGTGDYLDATIFEADGTTYIAVPPGTRQGQCIGYAAQYGYALPTSGPAPDITLGGFIANGCHGTGKDEPTVSDLVCGMEVLVFEKSAEGAYSVQPKAYATTDALAAQMKATGGVVKAGSVTVSPDAVDALRVGVGALGAITKLVLQLEALPNVQALDEIGKVTDDGGGVFDTADNLATVVESCDYTEIFWFPFNGGIELYPLGAPKSITYGPTPAPASGKVTLYGNGLWLKRLKTTTDAPKNQKTVKDFVWDTSKLAYKQGPTLAYAMKHLPQTTPSIQGLAWLGLEVFMKDRKMQSLDFSQDWGTGPYADTDAIVPLDVAFLYQIAYFQQIIDVSWAIPLPVKTDGSNQTDYSNAIKAWNALMEAIHTTYESDGTYPNNLVAHLRFIKNSNSLLSPAHQDAPTTHTCFIEYLSFTSDLSLYADFTSKVLAAWYDIGGLPHYAKAFQLAGDIPVGGQPTSVYEAVQSRLGTELQDFLTYRTQFDPGLFFQNDFLDQLL